MKTIEIGRDVKSRLDVFSEGKSINKTMRLLVESAEKYDVKKESKTQSKININMDDDVYMMLLKCKKYQRESHSETIARLLDEYDKKS